MTAATERQPLLRLPHTPPPKFRHVVALLILVSTAAFLLISFSNPLALAPPPHISFLLDRAVAGTVAPPAGQAAFRRQQASSDVGAHSTLYQHDLALINKAGHLPASVRRVKALKATLMGSQKPQPLLFPVVAKPSPYSAPYNLYMLWSRVMQDMSPGSTGEIFRRALRLGHVEGGEYRDAKFLPELAGRQFDDIAATCCSVVAVPPLSGGFIVYSTNGRRAEMIRAFLANGNAMVIAGGVVALEFLNRMFYSQLEPVESNYDEGPFRKSPSAFGPWKKLPFDSLGQIGTDVYAVKPSSLPEGSNVLFTSPDGVGVFIMPFCQRLNPQ